jgi:hypothetical protein
MAMKTNRGNAKDNDSPICRRPAGRPRGHGRCGRGAEGIDTILRSYTDHVREERAARRVTTPTGNDPDRRVPSSETVAQSLTHHQKLYPPVAVTRGGLRGVSLGRAVFSPWYGNPSALRGVLVERESRFEL